MVVLFIYLFYHLLKIHVDNSVKNILVMKQMGYIKIPQKRIKITVSTF